MGALWKPHGGSDLSVPWDVHEPSMGLPWDFHPASMVLPWDLNYSIPNEASTGLPRDYIITQSIFTQYETSMVLALDCHHGVSGSSMVLPRDSHGIILFQWELHGSFCCSSAIGTPMGLLMFVYGAPMVHPWGFHETPMGLPWGGSHGNAIGLPCGAPMGLAWDI